MGPRVRRDDTEYVEARLAAASNCGFAPCAPRTSLPGRAPVALPPRCVTTPETMVAS